jgi:hypothetical protein
MHTEVTVESRDFESKKKRERERMRAFQSVCCAGHP